jgi:hypothetical protein
VNEESILHFIRSMTATEHDYDNQPNRYMVRGVSDHYTVWDQYLLQEIDDLEHSNHVSHYIRLASDLNADEHAIQADYNKQLRVMLRQVSQE